MAGLVGQGGEGGVAADGGEGGAAGGVGMGRELQGYCILAWLGGFGAEQGGERWVLQEGGRMDRRGAWRGLAGGR